MKFPDVYDGIIQDAVRRHIPEVDWMLFKAQLFQESRLRPDVDSQAGAMGIAQFMPRTWGEVRTELKFPDDATAYEPEYAIPAGAYYMRKQRRFWSGRPIASEDLHRFALASYNAGAGNIMKAWRRAGCPGYWSHVASALPAITGDRNAEETTGYVTRIYRYHDQMRSARA
jgi:membrane-bound lytic murein transglycosylase F